MDLNYFPNVPPGQEDNQQQDNAGLEFKSYVPSYPDQAAVHDKLQVSFQNQRKFGKLTSPWDKPYLPNDVGLMDIPLDMNNTDRVYYLNHYKDTNYNNNLETCIRQDIGGQKIFIEINASYNLDDDDDDEFQGDGMIYMTKHPAFFLENSASALQNKEQIRSALARDGYRVGPEEIHEYMQGEPSYGNTVPHLQFLIHNAIYNYRNKLKHFRKKLPRTLSVSVDEFIQVKDGRM